MHETTRHERGGDLNGIGCAVVAASAALSVWLLALAGVL